jgi:carboxypeptidase Taq
MMPRKASDVRGKQMALIAGIQHGKETNPEIGKLLAVLEDSNNVIAVDSTLNQWEKANVRDARRNYTRATKITKELAQKEALLSSKGFSTWVSHQITHNFPPSHYQLGRSQKK